MNDPKKGLGRGLSALLGDAPRSDRADSPDGVRLIDVARIRPNPNQPRKSFSEDDLAELADSIERHGVLQPVLVREVGDGFQIIAGERRWRAAQRARLHQLPAIVRGDDDSSVAEVALIENIQRKDLNAIEEADGYRALIDRYGHKPEEVGKLVGKSRSHVSNLLRLLELPNSVKEMLLRGDISMGHARAVLTSLEPEVLAGRILAEGLSVRQVEELAKATRPNPVRTKAKAADTAVDADLAALERQLGDMLGLKVRVNHSGKGGSVTLAYSTLDQLDMICQRLSGEPI